MPDFEVDFELKPLTIEAEFVVDAGSIISVTGSELIEAIANGGAVKLNSRTYVHEQEVAADTWIINHNLGKRPSVTVVDTADEEQIPDRKVYNDENTVTLYFLAGFKGKAFLN